MNKTREAFSLFPNLANFARLKNNQDYDEKKNPFRSTCNAYEKNNRQCSEKDSFFLFFHHNLDCF
jgi:hypothetical protein